VKIADLLCGGVNASVTVNVSGVALAAAVGVPVIAPVAAFSVSPAGSVPVVNDHVYGGVPPPAVKVVLYGTPTSPLGRGEFVIIPSPAKTVSVRFAVLLCGGVKESATLNVSGVAFTAAVGVPVIAPVAALSVKPAGSVPAATDQV